MQAVILAAGRGTRLGSFTANLPKSLVSVGGRPILEHIFSVLTSLVEEVIIVVGYRAEQIEKHCGSCFLNLPVTYVKLKKLAGTADALWQARHFLKPGKFVVLNGDDLYDRHDLARCLGAELAMSLTRNFPLGVNYEVVQLDQKGYIQRWRKVLPKEMTKKVLMISGVYVLDQRIFGYEPVAIANNEYGLPQTILAMSKIHPVQGVIMKHWAGINSPEDLVKAEKFLKGLKAAKGRV